jgi:VWFA-related protein
VNPDALREITSLTGGYTEVVRSAADLAPATARIADELNKQYTIGYSSTRPPDGSYRALRVRVKKPDHLVRARRGYFADRLR